MTVTIAIEQETSTDPMVASINFSNSEISMIIENKDKLNLEQNTHKETV